MELSICPLPALNVGHFQPLRDALRARNLNIAPGYPKAIPQGPAAASAAPF